MQSLPVAVTRHPSDDQEKASVWLASRNNCRTDKDYLQTRWKKDYEAVVVGAGPNGLATAILLQQQGLSVLLVEVMARVGGAAYR